MAAVLWAGRQAIVSHRSAAALHGLEEVRERVIELYLPRGKVRAGVKVRRLSLSDRPRTRHLGGFVVTHIDRTLLDLASVLSATRTGRSMDGALRRKMNDARASAGRARES